MMRKKLLITLLAAMTAAAALPFSASADEWKQDSSGWWYEVDDDDDQDDDDDYVKKSWKLIDGKWYYFSPVGAGVYAYDPAKQQWIYGGGTGRPLGSMYKNEITPDGYQTDTDGAWIQ